jgi:ABC-2 type transport system ATP-binding protein
MSVSGPEGSMTMRRLAVIALAAALAASLPGRAAPTIQNGEIRSFDGTRIVYTLFLPPGASAASPVPIILMTHGWGGSRQTTPTGSVAMLLHAGYAVLTWDQRGFGQSGGRAEVDSQEFEVRDVQALIDLVARRPEIQRDGPGDPRMGMLGPSYAGGIQLMTAAADRRVDAIAPDIAWNDLPQALFPNGVIKLGWDLLLYAAGFATAQTAGLPRETGAYAPEIHRAFVEGAALNRVSPATRAWFDARSPRRYLGGATLPDGRTLPGIAAPTLLTQGTIDTLFTLSQAIWNAAQIAARGVPVKMVFYCGGHTLHPAGCAAGRADDVLDRARLAWFARWVRGDASVDVGPPIEYQTQDGAFHAASSLPTTVARGAGRGRLANTVVATSGSLVWATPAPDGVRVPVPVPVGAHLLGVPRARIRLSGVGVEASVFVKILDLDPAGRAVVVDDQATALKVTGSLARPRTVSLDLAAVAWRVAPGHRIAVEVSPTSLDHASTRTPFTLDVSLQVEIPYRMP